MAEPGGAVRSGPRKRRLLTRQGARAAAPDLVLRPFTAVAPDLPAGRGHDTDRNLSNLPRH